MGLETGVFLMVLASSMMHASWNLAARKVKGNQSVLALGQLFPMFILLPIIFFVDNSQPLAPAIPWVLATGVLHICYIFSLGFMYAQAGGNVSVVYPVARGSGVAMTVLLAGPLLGEQLTIQAYFGIASVILGVVAMGFSSKTPGLCEIKKKVFPLEINNNGISEQSTQMSEKSAKLVDNKHHSENGDRTSVISVASPTQNEGNEFVPTPFPMPPDIHVSVPDSQTTQRTNEHESDNEVAVSTVSLKTAHVLLTELNKTLTPSRHSKIGQVYSEEHPVVLPPPKGSNFIAICLALLTGVFICGYSLVDKTGVGLMNPVTYEFGMLVVENTFYIPFNFLSAKRRVACKETMRIRKLYCFLVGVGSMATYFIILYAFTLSHASFIVALRECAVVWGALFGVLFLKERLTVGMLVGTALIVTGVILMKTDGTE